MNDTSNNSSHMTDDPITASALTDRELDAVGGGWGVLVALLFRSSPPPVIDECAAAALAGPVVGPC
jgi:hypothetical protein